MLEKIIKDYFSFTRKERIAVVTLVLCIIIIYLAPYFMPDRSENRTAIEEIRLRVMEQPEGKDAEKVAYKEHNFSTVSDNGYSYTRALSTEAKFPSNFRLFYFDPNNLPAEGWKKLGLRDKTILTIRNYISKGGRFKSKEDINRIYGLHTDEIKRLMPYVRIAPSEIVLKKESRVISFPQDRSTSSDYTRFKKSLLPSTLIDLNVADSTSLIALPGIGTKLATRILRFRDKLGGFYSTEQLSEIYGLPDSTFIKIKPYVTITKGIVPSININTVQETNLKQHPYIKWNLANAIIEYRRQHGNFNTLGELHKIDLITEGVYNKINPYLKIE